MRRQKIAVKDRQARIDKPKVYYDAIIKAGLEEFNREAEQIRNKKIEINLDTVRNRAIPISDRQYVSCMKCYRILEPIFTAKGYGCEYKCFEFHNEKVMWITIRDPRNKSCTLV